MTAAREWINEGIEKGIEKGVSGMLKLGMDAPIIAAALELPLETVNQIIEKIKHDQ
jgi:predicted transposase YdaD